MSEERARPLSLGLNVRLSLMMFLQYAIWGAWLPLLFAFLSGYRGFTGTQIGVMFSVGAVGALVAPFIAGQIADRYFNTEKFLGLSHIVGGVLVWFLAYVESFWGFLAFSLAYSLVYSPTLSLTNSLAFHHMPDRDRDFGRVRVWGTVGWIVVGITIGQWLLHMHTPAGADDAAIELARAKGMMDAFRLSAILGVVMGVYCFFLPKTPPAKATGSVASLKAIGEFTRKPLLMLFLLAIPVSCIHQFYFVNTAPFLGGYQAQAGGFVDFVNSIFGVGGGGLMTIGQMSEILVLALIPLFARRISRKTFLAIGLVAYAARMAIFSYVDAIAGFTGLDAVLVLVPGIAMHGLCFGCFIFVSFMIVDEQTTPDVRASAQSLYSLVIFGVGIIVGSLVAGWVADWSKHEGTINYTQLFSVPMWASIACLIFLLAAYPKRSPVVEPAAAAGADD